MADQFSVGGKIVHAEISEDLPVIRFSKYHNRSQI